MDNKIKEPNPLTKAFEGIGNYIGDLYSKTFSTTVKPGIQTDKIGSGIITSGPTPGVSGSNTNGSNTGSLNKALSGVGNFISNAYKSFTAQPSGDVSKESQVGLGFSSTSNNLNNSSIQGGVGTANPTVVERVTAPTASPGSNNYYYGFNPYQPNANLGMSTASKPTTVNFFDPKKASEDALAASKSEAYQKNLAAAKKLFEEKVPPEESNGDDSSGDGSSVIITDEDRDGYDDKTGLNASGLTKEQADLKARQEAALSAGTDPSLIAPFKWEAEGKTAAQIAAEANILKAEQGALTARSKLMEQGEQGQATLDMEKYIRAQSAEKAGWTGGYRLDQNRQMDYLKASIQSSMYNAQEMQSYGFDSQLSAARLAYEQGKQQLALEYYNTAVTQAMNEAQLTGVYFSPEQKDMLTQYNTADSILKNAAPGTDEFKRAAQIVNTIDEWFSANGLSKTGTKTLAGIQASIAQANAEQSKLTSAIKTIEEQADGSVPLKDSNGKYLWNAEGTALVTFNPKTATAKEVYDFYSGKLVIDGKTITSGRGILNTTLQNEGRKAINDWFTSLSTSQQELSSNDLAANLVNYLNSKGINPISNYISSIESGADAALNLQDLIGSYGTLKGNMLEVKYTTGTGKTITVQFPTKGGAVAPVANNTGGGGGNLDGIVSSDTFENFNVANKNPTLYRLASSGPLQPATTPFSFTNLDLSQLDSNQEFVTTNNYNKLFSRSFGNVNNARNYDFYGKMIDGKLIVVRVKTN
jgi:hypothetical protein